MRAYLLSKEFIVKDLCCVCAEGTDVSSGFRAKHLMGDRHQSTKHSIHATKEEATVLLKLISGAPSGWIEEKYGNIFLRK